MRLNSEKLYLMSAAATLAALEEDHKKRQKCYDASGPDNAEAAQAAIRKYCLGGRA